MRRFLQRVLVSRGHEFVGATDGTDAVELAGSFKPELILMDLSLPIMDGLEATRLIRAMPEMQAIPIIAVTAHALSADEARARAAGCSGFLSKPYNIKDLLQTIANVTPLPVSEPDTLA